MHAHGATAPVTVPHRSRPDSASWWANDRGAVLLPSFGADMAATVPRAQKELWCKQLLAQERIRFIILHNSRHFNIPASRCAENSLTVNEYKTLYTHKI